MSTINAHNVNEGLYHRCKSLLSSLWIFISSFTVLLSSGFLSRCENSFATDPELPVAVVFTAARHSDITSTEICPLSVGVPRTSRIGRNSLDSYCQRNSGQYLEQDVTQDPSSRNCLSVSRSSPYISSSSTFDNTTISASISLESHSLYSSPPSSLIIHTPIITITAPSGETKTNCDALLCYDSDAPDEEDASIPIEEQRNSDSDIANECDSLRQPILGSLALRRGFQGLPIITSFPVQHVLISPSVPSWTPCSRSSAVSHAHRSPRTALLSPDTAYESDADLDLLPDFQSVLSTAAENNNHNELFDYALAEGHYISSKNECKLHGPNLQDFCQSASNTKPPSINSVSANECEQAIGVDGTNDSVGHDHALRCSEVVIKKPRTRRALSELPGDLSALTDFVDQVPTNVHNEEVERRFSFPYYPGRNVYSLKTPCESSNDNPQVLTSALCDQNVSSSESIQQYTNRAFASPLSHALLSTSDALGAMDANFFSPLRDIQSDFLEPFPEPLVDPSLRMRLTSAREYNTANLSKSGDSKSDNPKLGIGLSVAPVIVLPSLERTPMNTNLSLLERHDAIRSWVTLVNCGIGSNIAPDRRCKMEDMPLQHRDDCAVAARSGYTCPIAPWHGGQALRIKLNNTVSSDLYPSRRRNSLDSFSFGSRNIDSKRCRTSDIHISSWQRFPNIPPRVSCPPLILPIQLASPNSMGEMVSDHNSLNRDSGGGTIAHGSSGGLQQHTSVMSHALLAEIFDALNISSSITNSTSQGSNSNSSYSNHDPETVCKGNLASDSTISWGIAF